MNSDGKQLEAFVAQVERLLSSNGFTVTINKREFKDGKQVAEFDVCIEGKLGSTDIRILMECRDRPSGGRQPAQWIEELVGRRDRFNFSKVIAVSSTGFAPDAVAFAKQKGIELRSVSEVSLDEVKGWINCHSGVYVRRQFQLVSCNLLITDTDSINEFESLRSRIKTTPANEPILKSLLTQELLSMDEVCTRMLRRNPSLFQNIERDAPKKRIKVVAQYRNDDCFMLEWMGQLISVHKIIFAIDCWAESVPMLLGPIKEYRYLDSSDPIAQVATFSAETEGLPVSIEFLKLSNTVQVEMATIGNISAGFMHAVVVKD